MTPLCQVPQLSRESSVGESLWRLNQEVMTLILKSQSTLSGDAWMKPFQNHCQNTTFFFLLLFESLGNLATFYSDFPSGVCCLNAFHLMAYFRNLIWLSASDQWCCGNVTILDCLDAVFIKASHYYWGWREGVISPLSEHLLYWRAQPLHLCKGCGFAKFTFLWGAVFYYNVSLCLSAVLPAKLNKVSSCQSRCLAYGRCSQTLHF